MRNPEEFIARWRGPLEVSADIGFAAGERAEIAGNHSGIADAFVTAHGMKPIGFNWELLDAHSGVDEPRSALGVMAGAFANHMEFPKQEWLGAGEALACASDFAGLFDAASRTIVSNRLTDYWNPLTDAKIEWAFVGYDDRRIAVLIATI